MKTTGLLVAVVVLAALAGATWWSNKKQATTGKADNSTKILTIADDQFTEIRIRKLTGEVQDLKRDGNRWQLTEPKQLAADSDTAAAMVSSLGSLSADQVVDPTATDLKPYGLSQPTLEITITKKDGKTARVLIGDDTPTGSGSYAKIAGDLRVFTISGTVKASVDKTVDDLRDKRLMTFDPDKLTRVELQAKGQSVEFGKNGQNEWQIVKPRPMRAEVSKVETLVTRVKDAKMDLTSAAGDIPKQFAAAARVALVTVTDSTGNQSLEVRKDKDNNVYARSTAVEGIYKVAAELGDALDQPLDNFRNKKVFDFGFSDPTKLEIRNGAAAATYVKSGDKWMNGAKTLDNISVQSLIDKLRDLAATKLLDSAPAGAAVFEASVTSNDGKRVEKVSISKQNDRYLAKRENEPGIYELDGKAVEDLQKSASAVKEATPEPAKKK